MASELSPRCGALEESPDLVLRTLARDLNLPLFLRRFQRGNLNFHPLLWQSKFEAF